ncbi:MAG TPA: rod shape-determining protein [Armatimonadota bacterium]|nr:rod shape-determining protein [Armatimonadota bacterium]
MIWRHIWSRYSRDMGIDLGTANTLVHVRGRGIVLNEPSVVAVDRTTGQILAVGAEAKRMLGRTPANIEAVRPLKDGVIADFEISEAMLRYFIHRVHRRRTLVHPRAVIGIPSGVTEVERRAVRDAILRAGAREAFLIEEPMAAAIGAGLPVWEAAGNMVVDIGGGTSEVAMIALNGIVAGRSIRVAGDEIDEAIITFLHHEYNMAIGVATAENVKLAIGSAYPFERDGDLIAVAGGRDLLTGLPRSLEISAPEIREAIAEPVAGIVEAIRLTLEGAPAEISSDIMERGIVLTGGGALLRGIELLLAQDTRIPVRVAEHPQTCVVEGAGRALEDPDRFSDAFVPL